MRKLAAVLLATALCVSLARAQSFLFDDTEPPEEVSDLPTPFSPISEVEPGTALKGLSEDSFIRDTALSLRPRFYYRSVRNSQGVQDTFAGGGAVDLTTGWWKGFLRIGVTGYTTQPLVAVKNNNRSGLVESDGDGFFTLGQAWVKLRTGPATATLYRQTLNLPFINMNDARMIPNTFEAYQVRAEVWRDVQINAGYITQMKGRDTPDFVPMSEAAGAPQVNRGTAFAGFVAGKDTDGYLGAMSQLTPDLFCTSYVQTGYTWNATDLFELRGDLQFADQRSVGAEYVGSFATQLYGGRLSASYGGALFSFSYTNTARDSNLRNPFGADPAFNMLMISDFAQAGEQSYGFGVSYNFSRIGIPGLTAFSNYVYGALPQGDWEQEINATVDYRILKGPLNNLWLRLRYAFNEPGSGVPVQDIRVILNYTYTF